MSTTAFSPKRFGLYLKQYIANNIKIWVLASLVAIGIMVFFFLIMSDFNHEKQPIRLFSSLKNESTAIYNIGLFATGLILTVTSFNLCSTKQSGLYYLMLPATTFEKVFAKWLIIVPGFLVAYQLIWFVVSMVINLIVHIVTGNNVGLIVPVWKFEDFFGIISLFITLQAFYLAGTALTGKTSFLKTSLVLIIIVVLIALGTSFFNWWLFRGQNAINFSITDSGIYAPALHAQTLNNLMMPLYILFIPVCYTLVYCFFKEKEV